MEYFWKENKKFVVAVAGGFAFLILYNSLVLGPLRRAADSAATQRSKEKKDLERRMAQGVPKEETLVEARRDRDTNRRLLAQMVPEVAFAVDERFLKPKRGGAKEHFDDVKLELIKELKEKATAGKVTPPQNFGMEADVTEETAPELLLRLAVIDRLVKLSVESEIEKIEVIDGLFGMDQAARDSKKSTFLTKSSVFMRFSGKVESVFKVLHGAQKKGSYLAVTHFEIGRPDSTKDLFEASIVVTHLKVDDKAGFEARP
jgi:hypothetical protein